jgi:hypothetical protein
MNAKTPRRQDAKEETPRIKGGMNAETPRRGEKQDRGTVSKRVVWRLFSAL